MRLTQVVFLLAFMLAGTAAAFAANPPVASFESVNLSPQPSTLPPAGKALGDPGDFLASALAGANYLRYMQADLTEDNAGNGPADVDPDDAGWDWALTAFTHSAAASPKNIYGATANGLLQAWRLSGNAALWTAMKDAADFIVASGPAVIRTGADMIFLLEFAGLPEVTNPSYYQAGAQAIWTYRLANYGPTATDFAELIRDARGGVGGTGTWANGIIPWDIAPYCEAVMGLDTVFPGMGYAADAAAMAEVLYQDSFMANPGYYEPHGHSKGFTLDYSVDDYWFYGGGISGLIRAFVTTGTHLDVVPGLETLLHECQYTDGAFSYQYGAPAGVDDRDWQVTAYCLKALHDNLASTPANDAALIAAARWLASTQDLVSGGWVYTSGTHYPETIGESTAGVAYAADATYATVSADFDGPDPAMCGVVKTATVAYAPAAATPALRGYEVTFRVTGPATFALADIHDAGGLGALGLHQFYAVDNGDGTYTVNDALLGTTAGLLASADLFTVVTTTTGDGAVALDIVSFKLRDLLNASLNGFAAEDGFLVDCTAPPAVTGITAAPGHQLVDVSWSMADQSDVAYYEIYRGLWYDTAPGTSAYPEYDDLAMDVIPTRPADRAAAAGSAEWELAGTVPVGTLVYEDSGMTTGRGVYYYEVFAVDVPGNFGPAAADNDRATNYWLGDVDALDGDVDVGDISVLGATFGYGDGDFGYNNTVDVGPTDDWSGVGIPLTDSVIDFEDLMVFAMNFGNVAKQLPAMADAAPSLAWTQAEPGVWTLTLAEPCPRLKGVRVTAALPAGVSCSVQGGSLLEEQGVPVFLRNIPANGLDANLALIGNGAGVSGSGELLRVTLSAPADLSGAAVKARGLDNGDLGAGNAAAVPARFAVLPNFPNPFNPSTTIVFDLPQERTVRLAIFAVDGRLVRTLVEQTMSAGRQTVLWDGRDDQGAVAASGAYFFRLTAGEQQAVGKMLLIK